MTGLVVQAGGHAVSIRSEHPCPVCGEGIPAEERFPAAVCRRCIAEAVDDAGRRLRFDNHPGTGDIETYRIEPDGSEILIEPPQHRCYIRGRACWADESYGGNVLVVLLREQPSREQPL